MSARPIVKVRLAYLRGAENLIRKELPNFENAAAEFV